MGHPTIYPTGVMLYDKEKAYNGYTVYPSRKGALLIDMNGNEVQLWAGLDGFPNKILPGGYVLGSTGAQKDAYQELDDLVQADWDGKIIWKFNQNELVENNQGEKLYTARQHHDFQREGSATGYAAPNALPYNDHGKTLILTHSNCLNSQITGKQLLDDRIIEIDWNGKILWSWNANEHFEELGFDEAARNALYRNPSVYQEGDNIGDWLHINSISTLGPNLWYDKGDERFHPDNIIFDSRNANILAIISKETGKIVWKLGPDYNENAQSRAIGWIIGPNHAHMIPKGLPGEGDILLFDNGGPAGYGRATPVSCSGVNHAVRDYSRVLQINPVTLEITWKYTPEEAGHVLGLDGYKFSSAYAGSVQRLTNGNTLITEGSDGRIFEVTAEHEIVWEYINPYYSTIGNSFQTNMVYRAYRVPYDWIPQLSKPEEKSIFRQNVSSLRVPGSPEGPMENGITKVEGVAASDDTANFFIG